MIWGDCGDRRRIEELATALDGAGANVDRDVDAQLVEHGFETRQNLVPFGVNREAATWTDVCRKTWDLTGTWIDRHGTAWKWTGDVLNDQPLMRTEPTGVQPNAILEAIAIFEGPLTRQKPATTDAPF
jgi:hypothetical protein